ncbi:helix-turn-helix transcriptional regulator [Marivita hallyeonensis]|uniref:Transcriptional regulator, AraC family n=1 Tax=Marivita hallyeonensis TaxID=996342 RepID=A0A1M5N320_9RHOB|nr:AraC family transcriptional regulator [Marivita hallyeonensis]SHG83986.1 transcriptional regulator, AraC family [Marivita hallyeonensis]
MDGSRLSADVTCGQPVRYVEFRQCCSAEFQQLHISKTCLLRIRSGRKTVQSVAGAETTVPRGEFVYLRQGETLRIGNIIGETGQYLSEGLIIDDAVIERFLRVHPNPPHARELRKGEMACGFRDAFSHVVASLRSPALPDRITTHRMQELLLWLQFHGVAHRIHSSDALKHRLRKLLEGDVAHPWKAPDVARALAMSEATLRRALSREGTSFSRVLRDVRVTFALSRIQTTQQPLAQIALECGFSSQSRLSEAFKTRFGITPGRLRAMPKPFARIA